MSILSDWEARERNRLVALKQKIRSNTETEVEYEKIVICPWCGNEDGDDRYDGEGLYHYICGDCEKPYKCSVSVSISYSTSRSGE